MTTPADQEAADQQFTTGGTEPLQRAVKTLRREAPDFNDGFWGPLYARWHMAQSLRAIAWAFVSLARSVGRIGIVMHERSEISDRERHNDKTYRY